MKDIASVVDSLEIRIEALMKYCESLQAQNEKLSEENLQLRNASAEHESVVRELQEKQKILKLARSFSDTNEKTLDIKLKINEFVREIDKCIALLNR